MLYKFNGVNVGHWVLGWLQIRAIKAAQGPSWWRRDGAEEEDEEQVSFKWLLHSKLVAQVTFPEIASSPGVCGVW